ncbi:MAG: SDR family NAD(P)-dependent oxidoreductase [Gammaproteobacteria bacterium]|nr:SDR family NAD(P)-dependent oxidoreductase [Gammaproteobacteria bacterium]MDP7297538.1 SDR family NAD(P)-dependent oxidoreductase [Gammaproteobacteria bacterium]MDP7418542.1 SDR family NAD(P)-dependent oxidoreductase [Gammaproteobacteria bacterium]MDP7660532.1 SDR family NAD(P)-dependent oxidoreductase [Gammaproteobacteria bacterium]
MNRIALLFALLCINLCISTSLVYAEAAQQTVLITGANRGIGFEFVKQYSDLGYRVIATCRNPAMADELNTFAESHRGVIVEHLDLVDLEGIDALADKYADQPIDVLVNNAALMRGPDKGQTFGTMDYEWFDQWFHTNTRGPLKVSEAFWPNLVASENGIVASLTTGQGRYGIPVLGFAYYKSSKAAIDNLFLDVARKGKKDGVRVITISPGRVATSGEPAGPRMIPIQDSIAGMIRVFARFTLEQNGRSFRHDGSEVTF